MNIFIFISFHGTLQFVVRTGAIEVITGLKKSDLCWLSFSGSIANYFSPTKFYTSKEVTDKCYRSIPYELGSREINHQHFLSQVSEL